MRYLASSAFRWKSCMSWQWPASDEKQQEQRQKTAREVAFDGICSTIRQAYREWERQQNGGAKA